MKILSIFISGIAIIALFMSCSLEPEDDQQLKWVDTEGIISADPGTNDGEVIITWGEATSDFGAVHYLLYKADESASVFLPPSDNDDPYEKYSKAEESINPIDVLASDYTSGLSYTFTGLTPGQKYYFAVRCKDNKFEDSNTKIKDAIATGEAGSCSEIESEDDCNTSELNCSWDGIFCIEQL